MASCAMRGMRYISFPPIVFETPAHTPAIEAPTLKPQQEPEFPEAVAPMPSAPAEVKAELGIPVMASPAAPPAILEAAPPVAPLVAPLAAPPAAMRRLAEWAEPPQDAGPPPASGRLRRLSELSATESLAPGDGQTRPRYALLNDIAVELRPRRQRARTGQSQSPNRLKPNPTTPPWP